MLTALIGQHGPIPCIHVARERTLSSPEGEGPNALGQLRQDIQITYRAEASELRLEGGAVVLELPARPEPLLEPTTFPSPVTAAQGRDRLCAALGRLPWDRTSLGKPLSLEDAAVVLRHVRTDGKGMKVLPQSTSEISALTFEKSHENDSR